MNYLIDTNIISEVRKGRRCDPNVASWYEIIEDASLYLSVLVIGEIRKGIERVRPKDNAQANAIENWLAAVDKAFGERILPIDRAVANEWGGAAQRQPPAAGYRRPSGGNCQNPSHDAGDTQHRRHRRSGCSHSQSLRAQISSSSNRGAI